MRRLSSQRLFGVALAISLPFNAGCSNVSGVPTTPPVPPPTFSPCALPYQERANDLTAQSGITENLSGPEMVALWKSDAGQYNDLKPKFNANIEWAGSHCVTKPPETPSKPERSFFDRLNPF